MRELKHDEIAMVSGGGLIADVAKVIVDFTSDIPAGINGILDFLKSEDNPLNGKVIGRNMGYAVGGFLFTTLSSIVGIFLPINK